MINRLPWHKKLRTSSANNLDKINEVIDYINHSNISEVALSESGSGRNVQAGKASSLKDLAVIGEAFQDGTPTPDNPVPVQVVKGINIWDEQWENYGCIGLKIGDTVTPIDLDGNVLASLPDGTHDTLKIDSAGHVTIDKRVGVVDLGSLTWMYQDGIFLQTGIQKKFGNNAICDNYSNYGNTNVSGMTNAPNMSFGTNTGSVYMYFKNDSYNDATAFKAAMSGVMLYYELATPTTIELDYIEPPAIATDDEIQIIATITPVINASWWSYQDITELVTALKAYVDYKTTE